MLKLAMEQKGKCKVSELAKNLNISDRTLHRIFLKEVGINPKDYLKIIRFNHACKLMSAYPDIDWFEIIYNCGYYDQMHFIREFKYIMKATPDYFLKICNGTFYFERPVRITE